MWVHFRWGEERDEFYLKHWDIIFFGLWMFE